MGSMDGRVVVITGAGRGIGAAIARRLASEGALLVVNDLGGSVVGAGTDESPADDTVKAITSAGGTAVSNYADVSDYDQCAELINQAIAEFKKVDVVINVAGILRDRMLFNMQPEEWDDVIRVHLRGTFNTSRHAATYWRNNPGSSYRLINFSSRAALFGNPGQPNYAAAKMGIVGFTYSCANALERYGVTANAICPTAATRMLEGAARSLAEIGSDLEPENVVPAVAYVASDRSGWLNGRIIGASGRRIALYSNPSIEREIVSTEPWDLTRAAEEIEAVFRPAVEHIGVFDALKQRHSDDKR